MRTHTNPVRCLLALAAFVACVVSGNSAWSQLPQTRLYSLFPTGGQKGTTVEVSLTSGVDLDQITQLVFSHPGITAAQKTNEVNGQPQPVANTFLVTIASDVPSGLYEVRAIGRYGASNPRTFVVGDRVETQEVEPNNDFEKATPIEINTTVNGRAGGATDIDFFKFTGKKGERLLAECRALRIDSRMDATLELYGPKGKLLQYNRNRARRDPLIDFKVPEDGEYMVKVYDFLYGGSNEYVYRLSVHRQPHIDFVLPPSGIAGTTSEYSLYGRNLPGGTPSNFKMDGQVLEQLKVQIALPASDTVQQPAENLRPEESSVDGISYSLTTPQGTSNPVMIYFATNPVVVEQEPNDEPAQAQAITVPCEVGGQFQARRDVDYFKFEAKAKEVYWIEVFGQRNGTNADPYMIVERIVVNEKGEETVTRVTAQDDITTNLHPTNPTAFDARSDDAVFRFAVPADGTYRVSVRDRYFESRGGPQLVYRLSIRHETPDFRLVLVTTAPAAANNVANTWEIALRRGDNLDVDVMAFRQDGFNEVIDITAEGLPPGVKCLGASIGPGQTMAPLVFTTSEDAAPWTGKIRIVGKSRIENPEAVAATAAAEAAVKAAVAALPPLEKAAVDTAAAAAAAAEKAAVAKKAADDKPDDKGLAKASEDAATAANTAADAAKAAADKKAEGEKKIADAKQAAIDAAAAQVAAARPVERDARGGTVIWPVANNVPAISRVARDVILSVGTELAPYQVVADVNRVEVNQSSQILVPLKLIKRDGFDNNVTLTFVGQPANVQIENKPINKGNDSELARVFVQNNAAPGTYTIYLRSQGQVSYRRLADLADAAKAEKDVADKAAAEATELSKKAAAEKVAADKKATDTAAEAKKTADAKVAADKLATETATAAEKAAAEKVAADKAAADAEAAAKAAADAAAAAKDAADKDKENKDLEAAKVAAEKAAADAAAAAKTAADAKAAADKKATDTAAAAKAAADAKAVADKAAADAAALAKTAVDEQAVATKAAADAAAAEKVATAAKAAADKKATDTANVAKPANINVFQPSTPLIVTVKQGPATLAAAVPNGGALKKGESIEVKVTVNRVNGFDGPVELSLPLPPNVTGLTAAPVTIPADMKEGTLTITAAADATEGQLANLVVRGSMEFNGKAAVDQPIAIKVNP